jgi:hypothetical protein
LHGSVKIRYRSRSYNNKPGPWFNSRCGTHTYGYTYQEKEEQGGKQPEKFLHAAPYVTRKRIRMPGRKLFFTNTFLIFVC